MTSDICVHTPEGPVLIQQLAHFPRDPNKVGAVDQKNVKKINLKSTVKR